MSIGLATRGVLGSFVATASSGTGEPYPVGIDDMGIFTDDIRLPALDIDPEQEATTPIDFDAVEEYLPNKQSTIDTLPTAGLRTFPKPGNL